MMNITFELYATALLPVLVAVVVYLLEKTVIFKNMNYWVKQIIFGLVFGALAILGTERGVAVAGAQVNSRDASVLIGGLMFGWPTGIIAGVIGGVERWIAVAWGVGSYTRVACSVSTAIAGFYAAALRKYMFEDKKPGWLISLAIGVVMEVFHLTMVFITNMSDPERAMAVVKACAIPMITINGIAVMLASVALSLFKDRKAKQQQHGVRISQTIQRWLLLTVLLAFAVTSFFVFQLQTRLATTQADQTLSTAITDVADDISDASDTNLLNAARSVSKEATLQSDLQALTEKYDVAEISIVKDTGDHDAVIVASNNKDFINFHFNSGEQSREFLSLLDDTEECVQEYGAITSNPNIKRKYAAVKTDYGFVQVGYDAEHFQRDIDKRVIGITKNRHVGKTGYMFIFNQGKQVVSLPDGLTEQAIAKAIANTKQPKEDTTFRINLGGEECYSRYIVDEGYYIAAALPVSEALQLRNIAMYVNTFMEILVFAVLFALIYQLIKRVVVNQIRKINQSLARITEGDLGVVVDVRTNEEFASLSDDINSTVDTLKHYIDEASARIDKELGFAKDIQASALPRVFPAFPKRKDFDIFASMNPAKEVGGDLYDL